MKKDIKKIIIIGASSGIGKELAIFYASRGNKVGIAARRLNLLNGLKSQFPENVYVQRIDVREYKAKEEFSRLLKNLGGLDLLIISSGVRYRENKINALHSIDTIVTNVLGFNTIMNECLSYFLKAGRGHIVGLSSIASLRGSGKTPEYNASKAFISSLLQGAREKLSPKSNIKITDVRLGFVDTDMIKGEKDVVFVMSPKKAAAEIASAITKEKKVAYIPRIWKLIGIPLRFMPDWFHRKV